MSFLRSLWRFIWDEDSFLSWIANVLLALLLVKFVVYPGLGLLFGTTHPLVAVVSSSMDHQTLTFENWWSQHGQWYEDQGISKEDFRAFSFRNGFRKGDIIFLFGEKQLEIGQVVVYQKINSHDPPIIHRVVALEETFFQTKGDNVAIVQDFEKEIPKNAIIGKAVFRIPFLGYVKIWFVELVIQPFIRIFR